MTIKNRVRMFFRLVKRENEILKNVQAQIQYLKEQDQSRSVLMCANNKMYSYTQSGGVLVVCSEEKPELLTGEEYQKIITRFVNKGSIEVLTLPAAIAKMEQQYKETKELF